MNKYRIYLINTALLDNSLIKLTIKSNCPFDDNDFVREFEIEEIRLVEYYNYLLKFISDHRLPYIKDIIKFDKLDKYSKKFFLLLFHSREIYFEFRYDRDKNIGKLVSHKYNLTLTIKNFI